MIRKFALILAKIQYKLYRFKKYFKIKKKVKLQPTKRSQTSVRTASTDYCTDHLTTERNSINNFLTELDQINNRITEFLTQLEANTDQGRELAHKLSKLEFDIILLERDCENTLVECVFKDKPNLLDAILSLAISTGYNNSVALALQLPISGSNKTLSEVSALLLRHDCSRVLEKHRVQTTTNLHNRIRAN